MDVRMLLLATIPHEKCRWVWARALSRRKDGGWPANGELYGFVRKEETLKRWE